MSDIPLPRARPVETESEIPLPPRRRPVDRVRKAVEEVERQRPPAAKVESPRRLAYKGGEAVFHLLLPAVCVLLGGSLLLGLLRYVNHAPTPHDEPMLNFVIGVVLTGLGGLQFLVWWRRLRQLSAPRAVE